MTLEEAHQKAEAAVQTMQAMGLEDAVRGARAIMALYAAVVVPEPPPAPRAMRRSERRDAILNMWADGAKGREIAESLGIKQAVIACAIWRARNAGDPRAKRRNAMSYLRDASEPAS